MEEYETFSVVCFMALVGFLIFQISGCVRKLDDQRHQQAVHREVRLLEEQRSIQAAIKAGAAIEHGRTVIIMPRTEE